ncbi:GAF domain-containing protein [Dyadobacter psychrotolerans]|uniref:GAF domain-containing protein n=1 Tax=Dyadobacter psychrotolerans TaxID=2541721 RepID=A0A4R5DAV2_9BACT|nr:GAF domain-containing protein [Dyadobacter psychrotolerans]TDE10792.1 GAF domain-containing protein [Dyadobacter psychrotolerans]
MSQISTTASPFKIEFSFNSIIEKLEDFVENNLVMYTFNERELLSELDQYPELRDGITDFTGMQPYSDLIGELVHTFFPSGLSKNDIKAVTLPYAALIVNPTARLEKILTSAAEGFQIQISDFSEHQFYIRSCCMILDEHYGYKLDANQPMFCEIPTADGVLKYYRIMYNTDFIRLYPTNSAVPITEADIVRLINNYDDLDLWKEKFPVNSWVMSGFAIMTMYDATVEHAVSLFKEKLSGLHSSDFSCQVHSLFRSIYNLADLAVGFTIFNTCQDQFIRAGFGHQMPSYILGENIDEQSGNLALCEQAYKSLIERKVTFVVSDTDAFLARHPESNLVNSFKKGNYGSFVLAPVVKNGELLGVLELMGSKPRDLHSINADKLNVVMPFLTESVERLLIQLKDISTSIIQEKYTSIHPSVYWKFQDQVQKHLYDHYAGVRYELDEIVFEDVFPLYGQIDIKGSSQARNWSVQNDLQHQLSTLDGILQLVSHLHSEGLQASKTQIRRFLRELADPIKASTEQDILHFTQVHVHPFLKEINDTVVRKEIDSYFFNLDKKIGGFHFNRRQYEQTVSLINTEMAATIDARQPDAQSVFAHYYERFKTDGVEHNLYIGPSISPFEKFDLTVVNNLRFWQLMVLCEMEKAHHQLISSLPIPLMVTSLILVYNTRISIRFRMDEKRFDVDGSYNARYEIVKKRIDKAYIKDTQERITQIGKITIVYTSSDDEYEYRSYIHKLQRKNLLDEVIECFQVEDLQGISGLKALRIKIIH